MKRMFRLMILFVFCLFIVGCGNDENKQDEMASEVKLEEIMTSIKEQIAADYKASGVEDEILVEGQLQGFNEVDLTDTENESASMPYIEKLKIDTDQLEEGFILVPMMNVKSDEIILLKAKDEDQVNQLKKLLEAERLAQMETWERYLPDQYEKVQKNVIKTHGKYLLYVTYDYPEKIVQIFDDRF